MSAEPAKAHRGNEASAFGTTMGVRRNSKKGTVVAG